MLELSRRLSGRRIDLVSLLLLVAMIASMLVLLAIEAGRGIGFRDEGIYLLAARYPDEIQENVSAIYRFGGYLFSLVGHNPIYYRIAGMILVVSSALPLALGVASVRPWFNGQLVSASSDRLLVLLVLVVGSLLHYQWSYLTPSYYTFTAISVNVLTGLTLLALASLAGTDGRYRGLGLLYGLAFGIALFAKFPTALSLLVMTAVASAVCARPARSFSFALWVGAGFVCWLLFTFVAERPPALALQDFLQGWKIYQSLGYHNPAAKLLAYPKDVGILFLTGAILFLPSLAILVAIALGLLPQKLRERLGQWPVLSWGIIVSAVLVTTPSGLSVDVADRLQTSPENGLTRFYLAIQVGWVLLLGSMVFLSYDRSGTHIGARAGIVLLFLLGAPVAGSLGTSNPIFNVIQFYAAPWFALILALLWLLAGRGFVSRRLIQVVCVALCAYTTSNVLQGSWRQPAQIKPRTMAMQEHPTLVGEPPVTMLLDAETSRLVTEIRAAAFSHGFASGDDVIGFNQIPGLVYAIGGRSPGHPVFTCCRPAENIYGELVIGFADPQRLNQAFILLDTNPEPDVVNLLTGAGLDFPAAYELIATSRALGRQFLLYKPLQQTADP